MRVLITGGTGFLGSHLAELLRQSGMDVRALVRRSSNTRFLESLGVELAYGNLERGEGLDEAMRDVDAVVHGAGIVKARSPEEFHEVNAGGTRHMLDAARKHRDRLRRFVYVSSLTAHGFSDDGVPRASDAPARPLTHYGRSKLAGEEAVLAAKDELAVTIVRPPAIYGPRDVEMFAFFQMISRRLMPFLGSPDNRLSLIYAPDCARALRDVLTRDHPSGRAYFVEDGRTYTQAEFGRIVEQALGVRALRLRVPIEVVSAAAVGSELFSKVARRAVMLTRDKVKELRHPYLICSSAELQRDVGWTPQVELEEGARRTVDWYRSQKWL